MSVVETRLSCRKPVEFQKKLPSAKIDFLHRPMSILAVQIVDFDLQNLSYPLVLSDLNLEFGKAVKIAPQDHVVSAENSSNFLLQVCVINVLPSSS
jgi:hypothetical protein